MYYTEINPYNMKKIFVEKNNYNKQKQKELIIKRMSNKTKE